MNSDRDHLFDVRTVERNILQGKITRAEYEQWLEEQEDCSDLAENSSTVFTHSRYTEISGDDEDEMTDEEDMG